MKMYLRLWMVLTFATALGYSIYSLVHQIPSTGTLHASWSGGHADLSLGLMATRWWDVLFLPLTFCAWVFTGMQVKRRMDSDNGFIALPATFSALAMIIPALYATCFGWYGGFIFSFAAMASISLAFELGWILILSTVTLTSSVAMIIAAVVYGAYCFVCGRKTETC